MKKWFLMTFVILLISCVSSNEMTKERAYMSLVGFTQTDDVFVLREKGRTLDSVVGIVQLSQSKIEIILKFKNPPCPGCSPFSNGKATAFMTTDGAWYLDCISYTPTSGNLDIQRNDCGLNLDMDALALVVQSISGTQISEDSLQVTAVAGGETALTIVEPTAVPVPTSTTEPTVTLEPTALPSPTAIPRPTLDPDDPMAIIALSAGEDQSIALRRNGQVIAWGSYYNGKSYGGDPEIQESVAKLEDLVAITAGGDYDLALTRSGKVIGLVELYEDALPSGLTDIVAISSRSYHYLALRRNGEVVAWGSNTYGQADVPPGLKDVVAISAGARHSLALTRSGKVIAWGKYDQIKVPPGLTNVVTIAAAAWHSMALQRDGTLVMWGDTQEAPSGMKDIVAIAGGWSHSLALSRNGDVYAWGGNNEGQIDVPENVKDIVLIASGNQHSLALTRSGQVIAWGWNEAGQLEVPPELR